MTGVIVADLDRFKQINDTYGHDAGDEVLKNFAGCLSAAVRETDVVARLGGDEFVVVLENLKNDEELKKVLAKLTEQQPFSFEYEGRNHSYKASIGGAMSRPEDNEDLLAVIKRADSAMYERKAASRRSD